MIWTWIEERREKQEDGQSVGWTLEYNNDRHTHMHAYSTGRTYNHQREKRNLLIVGEPDTDTRTEKNKKPGRP